MTETVILLALFQEIQDTLKLVIQKFCCGPEILDQCFRSYRNVVHVPEIRETVLWIITKESARSRISGEGVLDRILFARRRAFFDERIIIKHVSPFVG
jgi:hypothetical protein